MEGAVQEYYSQGLAQSTARAHQSGQRRYISFCQRTMHNPLPLTESSVCQFVAFLAKERVKHASIKCYLSAIRHLQISSGFPDLFLDKQWPRLQYVLKGVKRSQGSAPAIPPRRPITPQILHSIRQSWPAGEPSHNTRMLWAAVTLGFFGFLRSGEFTIPSDASFDPQIHLTPQDIAVDNCSNPSLIRVYIKKSKTDPFRHGVHIFCGKTDDALCPVSAMMSYLAMRGTSPGFLFQFEDGLPLTRNRLVHNLRQTLTKAGIPTEDHRYSGHSFRIGAATTAAAKGLEDSLIKMLGRWESATYHRYISLPRNQFALVSKYLSS